MQAYPPGFVRNLRDRIAEVISGHNANDVPAICRRYGLATGERDEAMGGKFKYVSTRLFELSNDAVLEIAKKVAQEEGDRGLIELLAALERKPPAP